MVVMGIERFWLFGSCILTSRANAPVGHFCLVDVVAVIMFRYETRCLTHCAIDVDHVPTPATSQMVVIVDSVLVTSGRACGLDASNDPVLGHHVQSVVNGLTRDDSQLQPHCLGNIIGDCVR